MSSERNFKFDYMRNILAIFVIILHFNNSKGAGGLTLTNGISKEIIYITESFAICAVNCFLILSGYFSCDKKTQNANKVILLFMKVIGYQTIMYFIFSFIEQSFTFSGLIHKAIPINYFVWLYCTTYLLSPWLNKVIENISNKQFIQFLLILGSLFVIYPTIVDIYCGIFGTTINGISTISSTDSGAGYTLIQFILSYYLGAYLKKYPLHLSKIKCLLGYLVNCIIIFLIMHFTMNAIYYNNLFVVMSAFFLTSVFEKMEFSENKTMNYLSKYTFDIYIVHCLILKIWHILPLEKFLLNPVITIVTLIAMVVLMYVVSLIISIFVNFLFKPIIKKINGFKLVYRIE